MGKIQKALGVYREQGLWSLLSSIRDYFHHFVIIYYSKFTRFSSKIRSDGTISHDIVGTQVTVPVEEPWQAQRFATVHNERDLLNDLVGELNEDDVVLDVGAYLGWHTLTAASSASEGSVIAFEPHPVSFKKLSNVVEAVGGNNIKLYNYALSDHEGPAPISKSSTGGSKLFSEDRPHTVETQAVSGDEFWNQREIPQPTVVKVDVEGWEVSTLRGLSETISDEECRTIYCEIHPEKAPEGKRVCEEVETILEKAGFETEHLSHNSKYLIKASK